MDDDKDDDEDRKCQKTEGDITSEIEFVDIFRVSHEKKTGRQERTSRGRRKRG